MDFLFNDYIKPLIDNKDNQRNVLNGNSYVVYRSHESGTNSIKNFLRDGASAPSSKERSGGIYKDTNNSTNPYVQLIRDFDATEGSPGAGLTLKAADFAYLRDLGVYPINRLAILRRFREGAFVPENLEEMKMCPISTIVGWIKPDQHFGHIGFNETWSKTETRFDQLLTKIIKDNFGGIDLAAMIPMPDFAQGMLFELYRRAGLVGDANPETSVDEDYEYYDANTTGAASGTGPAQGSASPWGMINIPVGDPNVLQEGPFRPPAPQNIKSSFEFELTSTYEQKLIGDVDPGSAMLDILDNMYLMGTSKMCFYWSSNSPQIQAAREATYGKNGESNNPNAWWEFVSRILKGFWEALTKLFEDASKSFTDTIEDIKKDADKTKGKLADGVTKFLSSILTSTIAIHRFELRGSIELMTGGKLSSTPWYLTLGNPYSPWIATNHIIVKSASVETSTEMGFNDQPQWLTVKFNCEFSRALGKQELMRMFNNSYRRTYNKPVTNNSYWEQVSTNITNGNINSE
jgi:hypothetical protein